jgi:P pilus assembly chaperone PapD
VPFLNARRQIQSAFTASLFAASLIASLSAHASVTIDGTSVIYNAQGREPGSPNPTPYHVLIPVLEVTSAGMTAKFVGSGMVGPGETRLFPLKGELSLAPDIKVHDQTINGYGLATDGEAVPAY